MPAIESTPYELPEVREVLPELAQTDLVYILERLSQRKADLYSYRIFQINYQAGRHFFERMDFERSITCAERCLHVDHEAMGKGDLADVYLLLGGNYYQRNDYDDAIENFKKVLAFDQEQQNIKALINLALVYTKKGNYEKAIFYHKKIESFMGGLPPVMQVTFLINAGFTYFSAGNYPKSREYNLRSLEMAQDNKLPDKELHVYFNLGKLELADGDVLQAKDYFEISLSLCREHDFRHKVGAINYYLGKCHYALGEREEAIELFEAAHDDIYTFDQVHLMDLMNQRYASYKKSDRLESIAGLGRELIEIKREFYDKNRLEVLRRMLREKEDRISKLEQYNEEITQRRKELVGHNRDLEEFARIVSQDFKKPLGRIDKDMSLLSSEKNREVNAEFSQYLDFITNSYEQLAVMLGKLQHFVGLHLHLDKVKQVRIEPLLEKLHRRLQLKFPQRQIAMDHGELPSLCMNPELVEELFYQLMSNSVKFNEEEQVLIRINWEQRENGHHHFEIGDNGIGIRDEYQESTFRLFSRLDKDRFPGVGIGLATCKKIVQLHNGMIGMRSNPTGGITVSFDLKDRD